MREPDWNNSTKTYQFGNLTIRQQAAHRLGLHVLSPLRCGFQICEKGHVNDPWVTPQYALVYILSGDGYYEDSEFGQVAAGPGSFVQRFPDVEHKLILEGYAASFFLAFPAEALKLFEMTNALATRSPVMYVGLMPSVVQDYLSLINEMKSKRDEELMSVMLKVQQTILRFHQLARRKIKTFKSSINDAVSILSQNFDEKIVLPELADSLNLSYSSFRKQFTRMTGQAPGDFRISKKIEFSQELLLEGHTVKETAHLLVYPDAYTFSRQFKKVTGLSPTEFIKMNR